uniref:Polymerase (DNA-directed), delta interacting protein 3 n=1 Tax=Eptatretus burgeri TaxID=7764 RepID=A0A8C4N4X4_EPTBU
MRNRSSCAFEMKSDFCGGGTAIPECTANVKMADCSLDEVIRKRGLSVRRRIGPMALGTAVKSRLGDTNPGRFAAGGMRSSTFDARMKLSGGDARLAPMRDAREKLRSRGVRPASGMNPTKGPADARYKLHARRSDGVQAPILKVTRPNPVADSLPRFKEFKSPGLTVHPMPVFGHGVGLTKTIRSSSSSSQDLKRTPGMSIVVSGKITQPGALKLRKVVENKSLTKRHGRTDNTSACVPPPAAHPGPLKIALPQEIPSPTALSQMPQMSSPLEGVKLTVTNLHPVVTEEDIVELFSVYGALKRAKLMQPGAAEVVYVRKDDAVTAFEKYNNRFLDGQPMKCHLHEPAQAKQQSNVPSVIKRLSDKPSALAKQTPWKDCNKSRTSVRPYTEVDPDIIQKALFNSASTMQTSRPTAFRIKI